MMVRYVVGPCCCGCPIADTVVVVLPSLATETRPPPLGFTRATFWGKVSVFPSIVLLSLSWPLIVSSSTCFGLFSMATLLHRNYTPALVKFTSSRCSIVAQRILHHLHVISVEIHREIRLKSRNTKNGRGFDKIPISHYSGEINSSTHALTSHKYVIHTVVR